MKMDIQVSRGTIHADAEGNVIEFKNNQFSKFKKASIPIEAIDSINQYLNAQDLEWKPGVINIGGGEQGVDIQSRKSDIAWIGDDQMKQYIMNQFESANVDPDWNFDLDAIEDIQYTKYYGKPDEQFNGHYDWHNDTVVSVEEPRRTRKLSMTLMLSEPGEEFEGGMFQFQTLVNGNIKQEFVPLKKGDILVFPSSMSHRIDFVTNGCRSVLVAWAWGPLFK